MCSSDLDLNVNDVEAAAKIVAGTARSMGITVEGSEQLKYLQLTSSKAFLNKEFGLGGLPHL